ncbi:MAG: phosphoglycerate kinase, partial [Pseudomonadota bacterium]
MTSTTTIPGIDDIGDIAGKTVLVRVDLNVPMAGEEVSDATRIVAVAPTISELSDLGAKVALLAHFGRPKGNPNPDMSLSKVVGAVAKTLGRPVSFAADCVGDNAKAAIAHLDNGGVIVLENTRFHPGEERNDAAFADALAALGDIYVNDAFSAAHRAHASTEGLAKRLPAFAGRA